MAGLFESIPSLIESLPLPYRSGLCHCCSTLCYAIAPRCYSYPLQVSSVPPHCCSSPHTAPRCHCTTTLCSARALLCLSELFQRKSLQVLRTAPLFSSITLLASSFAPQSGAFPSLFFSIPCQCNSVSSLCSSLPFRGYATPFQSISVTMPCHAIAMPCHAGALRIATIQFQRKTFLFITGASLCRYTAMPQQYGAFPQLLPAMPSLCGAFPKLLPEMPSLCNAFRSNAEASHLLFPALSRVSFPLHFYALAQLNMFSPKSIRTPQNKKPLKSISVPPPYENFPTTDFPFFAIKHCRKARPNTIFDVSIGFPGKARPMDACCPCPISDTHG